MKTDKEIEKEIFESCKAKLAAKGIKIMYQKYFDTNGKKRKRIISSSGGIFDDVNDLANKISCVL